MKKISLLLLILCLAIAGQAQKGKTQALTAIGGSGGLLLYNTYLVVGLAADGYASKGYTSDEAREIVNEQMGGVETIKTQYNDLIKSGFLSDDADVKFMKQLLSAFGLVEKEITSLLKYLDSGSDTDALIYDEDRRTAWNEISNLLGLNGDDE